METFKVKHICEAYRNRLSNRHFYPLDEPYLSTGITAIDYQIGGFPKGRLTIITAERTTDTTSLISTIALRMSKMLEISTGIMTTSYQQNEKFSRLVLNNVIDKPSDLSKGISKQNITFLENLDLELQKIPLWICNVQDNEYFFLKYQSRYLVVEKRVSCIFVDFLQALVLDDIVPIQSYRQRLRILCEDLGRLAYYLDIPIVVVAHKECDFSFNNYAHLIFEYEVLHEEKVTGQLDLPDNMEIDTNILIPTRLSILFDTYGRTGQFNLVYDPKYSRVLPICEYTNRGVLNDAEKKTSTPQKSKEQEDLPF